MNESMLKNIITKEARKELKQLQEQHITATAEHDTLKAIQDKAVDDACKLLNLITEEGEPADHRNDFMLSESDFERMLKAAHKLITAQGIEQSDPELVISHEAWLKIRQTEKDLAAWGAKYLKDKLKIDDKTWETMTTAYPHQDRYINLTLRMKC